MKILLIEDDNDTYLLLQTVCYYKGHQLHWSQNGVEALQAIRKDRFDIVLSDIGLPDINGLLLAQALKESAPPIPLVFLTGSPSINDQAVGESLGAVDYIHKPFNPTLVIERLQSLLMHPVSR